MQIKTPAIWAVMVGAALAMNLARSEYRYLAFPLLLLLLPFLAAAPGTLLPRVRWPRRGWREFLLVAAAIIVLFPPGFFLYHLIFMKAVFVQPTGAALLDAVGKSLLLAATAAIPEEFFFRGWLQGTALARHDKPALLFISRRNLFTSVFFGSAHAIAFLNPLSAATFFPSLLFGWLTERSEGSIVPAVLLHAVANLVLFLLLCFVSRL